MKSFWNVTINPLSLKLFFIAGSSSRFPLMTGEGIETGKLSESVTPVKEID